MKSHWREWMAEFAGTALLIVGGLGAVTLNFGQHSVVAQYVSSHSLRLLLTGALFAGTGSLVALSPLGRTSGAHLNPAVSVAFWLSRKMHATTSAPTCRSVRRRHRRDRISEGRMA
jgi:aquaporin Z